MKYDVIIIGSGPAGLTAAMYTSRAELKTLILAGATPGGQLMITSDVENYPGFPEGVQGPELMDKMIKQGTKFGSEMKIETVKSVDFASKPFLVATDKGTYEGKSVIIASGADARWLGLESEQALRGKGVSACATCDGFFFKGKEIVVVGGGDGAMEEALFLTKFASKVTIAHRSDTFKASKIMLKRAKDHQKIEMLKNTSVVEVLGKDKVEGVKFKNTQTGEERDFKTQGVFVAIGHKPNTEIYKGQLEINKLGYVEVKNHTITSVEGIFTAGDVNDSRYRQAVTAAGMGCMAAIDSERWLTKQE
ncbi:MAG: thioredoxin-disulfide reductase [Candidatus Doudnabacteria bacterium CG10_big_fil_rev_8_21_14_0_10_41_10]|uniref:Thioredoxin reductase n=1 Tax=Candidatus Doudnabacteria bacterium CG10_big_fil_rev_8_21_14_0_10_41_10 TaxID=1974551 RepID=A0A2H0VDU2_9BACT|nr:MAG: thioredoxin-disulfide reductase [Candidatus Doudnabacteria bacterium CG10_big_fil_rev_8_21_14_0_10_41_10]